ncbi:DNA cytosine methyltransferase [Actinokineospora soli]|uniref:DNA (cytosine-5-)-methyltransferase n=1 Tax=Actinokineospora soli TaxID=1048753 RepID=A0ABW2TH17_9PSEU
MRNRVILLAFRGDLDIDEDLLARHVRPTHSERALIKSISDGTYWGRHPKVPRDVRDAVTAGLPDLAPADGGDELKPWFTLRDALAGYVDTSEPLPPVPDSRLDRKQHDDMPVDHVGWPDARIYPGHTPNVLDRPAKTVKAGVHGVPGGESVLLTDETIGSKRAKTLRYKHRYMTVREAARVMTFPDSWRLCGPRGEKMRQLGNAVPVRLGEVFANAVARVLDEVESRS